MEFGTVKHFLKGKTILVTGATGLLGKLFVEKILRVQPDVKKIYLLLRASNPRSARERLQNEIIGKDLFRVLRDKLGDDFDSFISDKVIAVVGDVSVQHLGIKDESMRTEMLEEIDIVVHSAATTKFDERFDIAMRINTIGALHVVNFAKNCCKVQILLHVSTAYVCGEGEGLILEEPMGQTLRGCSELDIEVEKKLMEKKLKELREHNVDEETMTVAMRSFGTARAKEHGWPNTYVYTKAMGEMLVGQEKENLPVVIIRPTIITSTYKEPFPGWVEGVRTIDSFAVAYGKGKLTCFLGDLQVVVDVIPADMVVNAIIVAMVVNANQPCDIIYNVGSSVRNPIRNMNFRDCCFRYFKEKPWTNKDGMPIKVGTVTVLDNMDSFQSYMFIRYELLLKGLNLLNQFFCKYFQKMCNEFNMKLQIAMRLVELYKPYLFFKAVFDDMNTEKLRMAAREGGIEMDLFYFDSRIIDWEEYFMNIHIPGIVKYISK